MIASPERRHEFDPVDYVETALTGNEVASIPVDTLTRSGEVHVIVHYAGGPFRVTLHGTAPSPTFGGPAEDGDADDLNVYEAKKWRVCLAQGATIGTIRAWIYERRR